MLQLPVRIVKAASQWHLRSQQTSRRNAMLACTDLAERRRELVEVEEFLAQRAARVAGTTLEVGVRPGA
jgi:hypothetical protein